MVTEIASPLPDDREALVAEIRRLNKVVTALINRAERDMSARTSDFGLFQTTIRLEDQVRARTRDLENALRENEKINRDLQRAQERMAQEIDERQRALVALEREKAAQQILIHKLEQATSQLVQTEKLASLGSVVAGVAHELSTPLGNTRTVATTLKGLVEAFASEISAGQPLRRQALTQFVERCLEAALLVERNSQRAAELIGNFKQVAVDQTSMRRRSFDLRQALEEVLSTLQPQFKTTRHRLELAIEPGIILDTFPGPLEQIIANLVSNSLKHGFEGIESGTIRIVAGLAGNHVALRYTDDGVGIPEPIAKRVFDPFFTTKLGQGGSGLGLYIAYNLATAVLGGTIELMSWPGRGVRFEVLLPRVAPGSVGVGKDSYRT